MNKVIFMGNVGKDPDVRYSNEGKAIASFSLAVKRAFAKKGEDNTDWFNLVCFNKTAEIVEKYVHKGTKLICECEARNNNYTDKNGNKVYSIQFIANSIEFCESKASQEENKTEDKKIDDVPFEDIPNTIDEELPFR